MLVLPKLYAIVDTVTLDRRGIVVRDAVEALLEGGARLIQLRHKGHFSREMFFAARTSAELCRQAGASFLIDDRADIAKLVGAGVHVGQDDLAPRDARLVLGAGPILGLSTHNEAQLMQANGAPADYLAIGPVYATASKSNPDPVVGPERLARLRRLTTKPLVAIGGITRANAAAVFAAGIDCAAVIGDLFPESCTKAAIRRRAEEWLVVS